MTRIPQHVLATLAIASIAAACSSSSGGGGGSAPPDSYAGRRSTTCYQLQDALCDYAADQCGELTRADCDDVAQSLFCKDDALVQRCLGELDSAQCGDPLLQCEEVADKATAVEYCQELIRTFCQRVASCTAVGYSDCALELNGTLRCELALGVAPSGDRCLAEIAALPCGSIDQLPVSCQGVVKLNQ